MIHQEPVINALSDRDSILPHVITSIGSPMPIKLKVASEIIAVLTFITTINIMDEKKFGTRCFHKIRKNPAPIHLAAMIYSLFRICRTSVRTTFAILVQLVTPITKDRLRILASPMIACSKMIRSRVGILKNISVNLIISSSSQAGATPLKAPTTTAIKVEITVANPPIKIEILPPYQIMEKISLPIVSVPKRNSLSGALL